MILKNYEVASTGFKVTDVETGHILQVSYKDGFFDGAVVIPEQDEFLPLAPWERGENPFQDDQSFEGEQTGFSENGSWWFAIRPSAPFSRIMAEVEALASGGLVKRITLAQGPKLAEVVPKVADTGYLFWNINDDLGHCCDDIVKGPAEVYMAYGYARRTAMVALHLQGLVSRENLDHVRAIFKSIQNQTGQTIEFQRQAFLDSIEFMQTYTPFITGLFAKMMFPMVGKYEPSPVRMKDADFFKVVNDLAHDNQQNAHGARS